jgi:hypothetical protein
MFNFFRNLPTDPADDPVRPVILCLTPSTVVCTLKRVHETACDNYFYGTEVGARCGRAALWGHGLVARVAVRSNGQAGGTDLAERTTNLQPCLSKDEQGFLFF